MGKSSAPAPPNATLTAQQQAQANAATAADTAALDYVNQNTPYGSTSYVQTGSYTDPQGTTVPTYSENVSLSPLGQSILGGEQGVVNTLLPTAQTLAGNAATSAGTPLNFNTADAGTLNSTPQVLDQRAADAEYRQQTAFLDPQFQQEQQQLQDQLSRQGIGVGSDAYNNAETNFATNKNQAYQSAADTALAMGSSAASNQFNMALAGQQQNLAQQIEAQRNPIDLLGQLFNAAPQTQTQPITQPTAIPVGQTDVTGAVGLQTQAQQQAYQAQLAQQNATFGGLASLGSAAMLAFALSDPRVKDIGGQTAGALGKIGQIPVSDARYKTDAPGTERPMVMAPDVQQQVPGAVSGTPGGPAAQVVNMAALMPLAIAGIQELDRRTKRRSA